MFWPHCSNIYFHYCISYHKIHNTNWLLKEKTTTQFCDCAQSHPLSNTLSSVGPAIAATWFPSLVLTQPFKAAWPPVPITKVCSWKEPMKASVKSGRKELMHFSSELTRRKSYKIPAMRPVYYQLLRHNAATLWTYIHVLQPCASLQRLLAMCTCPVHTESSLLHLPGSLLLSEHTSVAFYKTLCYMIQCLMCCEMEQCQEQCPRYLSFNYQFGRKDKWSRGIIQKGKLQWLLNNT